MSIPALLPTDVLVLGGGAAGATAALLLARRGIGVTVIAGALNPPSQVGVSLAPGALPLLDELGVREVVGALPHTSPSVGVCILSQDGERRVEFPFAEALGGAISTGFHLRRDELELALLSRAREEGAEVLPGWRANSLLWEGARLVGVIAAHPDGAPRRIQARTVLDATGGRAFVASRMGWRFGYPRHRRFAVQQLRSRPSFDTPQTGYATLVTLRRGWFWCRPLGQGEVGVGAVLDQASLPNSPLKPESALAVAEQAPAVAELLRRSEASQPAELSRDFSFRVLRVAGDGFCLLGDAAGFFDPVTGSGLLTALSTATSAAQDVVEAFARHGRVDAADFGPTVALTRRLQRVFFSLAWALNDPRFLPLLFRPPRTMGLRAALVGLLAGDVLGDGLWRRTTGLRLLRLWARGRRVRWQRTPSGPAARLEG